MSIAYEIMNKFSELTKRANTYEIVSGDTLGQIAQKNGLTLQQLYEANPLSAKRWISNPRQIQIGEKINLPTSAVEFGQTIKGLSQDEIVNRSAQYAGIDSNVLKALIEQESGGNAAAVSPVGAKGMGQLMDARVREFNVSDPFDPSQNIPVTATYLAQLYKDSPGEGDEKLWNALMSYNWGPTAFSAWYQTKPLDVKRVPQQTQNYAASIFRKLGRTLPDVYANWFKPRQETRPVAENAPIPGVSKEITVVPTKK